MGIVLIILSVLLQFVLPILVVMQVRRRFEVTWGSIAMGLLALMGSSVFYNLVLSALGQTDFYKTAIQSSAVANLLVTLVVSCLFQVAALWLVFRYAGKDKVLPFGMVGIGVGYAVINILLVSGFGEFMNFASILMASIFGFGSDLPADQLVAQQAAIASYWNPPAYIPILRTVLAYYSMVLYLSLLAMTWVGYVFKKWQWFAAAVLWGTAVLSLLQVGVAWLSGVIDPYNGTSKVNDPWFAAMVFLVLVALQFSLLYGFWKKVYPAVVGSLEEEIAAYKAAAKAEASRRAAAPVSKAAKFASAADKKAASPSRLNPPANVEKDQAQSAAPLEVKATKATKPTKLPKKDE
jgi:hypothetical protein